MSMNINQREYTFTAEDGSEKVLKYTLIPAKQGIPLAAKLSGVLTSFFEGGFSVATVIEKVANDIDLFELATVLLKDATIDRGDGNDFPLNVSTYFAGNYGEMVDCIWNALQENFGSFFKAKAISSMSQMQQSI